MGDCVGDSVGELVGERDSISNVTPAPEALITVPLSNSKSNVMLFDCWALTKRSYAAVASVSVVLSRNSTVSGEHPASRR